MEISTIHSGRLKNFHSIKHLPAFPEFWLRQIHVKKKHASFSDACFFLISLAQLLNGWRNTMVSSRSGPVETMSTGTSQI